MLDNKDFEDKAWEAMSEILDKELPEEKVIFWWRNKVLLLSLLMLFIAVIGTGVIYNLNNNGITNDRKLDSDSSQTIQLADQQNSLKEDQAHNLISKKITNDKNDLVNRTNDNKDSFLEIKSIGGNNKINENNESIKNSSTNIKSEINNINNSKSIHNDLNTSKSFADNKTIGKKYGEMSEERTSELSHPHIEKIVHSFSSNNNNKLRKVELNDIASRRVNFYAYTEYNYFTNLNSRAISVGLLSEIGDSSSPLSFITGINYKKINLESQSLFDFNSSGSKVEVLDAGGVFNEASQNLVYVSDASYIGLPISFHYRMNRFQIGLGLENNFLVNKHFSDNTRSNEIEFTPNTFDDTIFKYQLNFTQTISYNLSNSFSAGANFKYDLTGFRTENYNTKSYLHNFSLSLLYKIK